MKPVSDSNLKESLTLMMAEVVKRLGEKISIEAGMGLSQNNFTNFYKDKLDNLEAVDVVMVESLPNPEDAVPKAIYFSKTKWGEDVVKDEENNFYWEYMCFSTGWEIIGDSRVDLSNYFTKQQIEDLVYNKTQIDTKFGNYLTKEEITTMLNLHYTSAQVDENFYNKTHIDGRYYQKSEVYTKTEADTKYQPLVSYVSQDEYEALTVEEKQSGTYFITSEL